MDLMLFVTDVGGDKKRKTDIQKCQHYGRKKPCVHEHSKAHNEEI